MNIMTSEQLLNQDQIKKYIPHRFENLLLDKLTVYKTPDKSIGFPGLSETVITENDNLNRHLFYKKNIHNEKVIISPVLLEILALAAVCSTEKLPPGFCALFASISHYKKLNDSKLGEKIICKVTPLKIKSEIFLYHGEVFNENNTLLATADLMAALGRYDDLKKSINQITLENKEQDDTTEKTLIPINKSNTYKNPALYFVDALINQTDNNCKTKYTYPKNHPFTKGHFEGFPIMMGISQIIMIEDAASLFVEKILEKDTIKKQDLILNCNAEIKKNNGNIVANLKNAKIKITIDPKQPIKIQSDLIECTKIVFRNIVAPGETLFAELTDIFF